MSEKVRLAGLELYFDNLAVAKHFYQDTIGLELEEDRPDHHAKFATGGAFLCLERKGVEDYSSADKAVVFLEVPDVRAAADRIGPAPLIRAELTGARPWAAIRDPEGHTILLLQQST